jgi:hypothetical protein
LKGKGERKNADFSKKSKIIAIHMFSSIYSVPDSNNNTIYAGGIGV